jgi:hypothetical protein
MVFINLGNEGPTLYPDHQRSIFFGFSPVEVGIGQTFESIFKILPFIFKDMDVLADI